MSSVDDGFEFDALAQRPMYQACPRWLIEHCEIDDHATVVDLGCGSGIVTRLLLERFNRAPDFRVIAIDPSDAELQIARSRIADARVTFIRGSAQEALSLVPDHVDAVLLCNVLHLLSLPERRSVLAGAFALVRPGGVVGANTLFYEGGIEPDTRPFYLRWMMAARRHLARAAVPSSLPTRPPVAMQQLTPQQHFDLFNSLSYEDIEVEELQIDWQLEDWEALCRYSSFIQGALSPAIDLASGSRALIEGVRATYLAMGIETVRRGWLHCAARRPTTAPRT